MDKQLTVLITRPQPGADAFAAALAGLPTVISPLMEIKPVPAALPESDVVIITSSHAIPAVAPGTLCYCVGEATTAAARAAGLEAIMAGSTAQAVARRVISDRPRGQILYARGRHVAFDMVAALRADGLSARDAVIYDQVDVPLTADAQALLAQPEPVIVPLFSARSAQLFFQSCPEHAHLIVIAMSAAVAGAVPDGFRTGMSILPNPDAMTMAHAVRNAALHGKRLEQGQ